MVKKVVMEVNSTMKPWGYSLFSLNSLMQGIPMLNETVNEQ